MLKGPLKGRRRYRPAGAPIIVDLFAGGGGASTGIEAALGRAVDDAVNHDKLALRVHGVNHPRTVHHIASLWEVEPRVVTAGRPVALLWASPDCTHFSIAKGARPREQRIRALAWVVRDWAREVEPEVIMLENVREFLDWGPLYPDDWPEEELRGTPIPERKGETFRQFVGNLEMLGYRVGWRLLDASHFGAPTRRVRLFLVARRDGQPISWPEATHGPGKLPFRTAAECIDWALPCPSIFERKRPLAEKTLWRIAEGLRRFVLENPRPFVVGCGGRAGQTPPTASDAPLGTITRKNDRALVTPTIIPIDQQGSRGTGAAADEPLSTVVTKSRHALVAPTLIQTGYGERRGQAARVPGLHVPLGTVVATGQKHALVAPFLAKHYGGVVGHGVEQPIGTITATDHHSLAAATLVKLRGTCTGSDLEEPMPTLTAGGNHVAEVRAFLTTYYGEGSTGQRLDTPLRTITAKARLGLVTVEGHDYQISDIGMRMLEPHELLRAQFGRFAEHYDLSACTTKADAVRLIGNSVCPEVAEALVRANLGERVPAREAA
jgi:DNA (cytosine-5)-methyltransferase 1